MKEVKALPEKRKIGTYAIAQSCDIGDVEVLLIEDTRRQNGKYGVATVETSLVTFGNDPEFIALDNDYLSMLDVYAATIQKESQRLQLTRRALDVPKGLIDPNDLMSISDIDLAGKLICLHPDCLKAVYRIQAFQVVLAESGFGCSPTGRGRKIYGIEVATGDKVCYARDEVQGVLQQDNLPSWLERKLDDRCYLHDAEAGTWQRLQTLRFICPLHAEIAETEDGEYDDPTEVEFSLTPYEDQIQTALDSDEILAESERGLMAYYNPGKGNEIEEAVARKVWDYCPTVESIGKGHSAKLYGVIECHLKERLSTEEMEALKDDISGQLSDGWGEGFEQRPVETDEGELYVSFWSSDKGWALTEESQFLSSLEQKGVQLR